VPLVVVGFDGLRLVGFQFTEVEILDEVCVEGEGGCEVADLLVGLWLCMGDDAGEEGSRCSECERHFEGQLREEKDPEEMTDR